MTEPVNEAVPRAETATDVYLDIVETHRETILDMYRLFSDKQPVMLFDVASQRIYAYPYNDFKRELNPRGQTSLTKQYAQALRGNQVVVSSGGLYD